jgi:aryl-alcohol dehydrogenase-like predicted oxidoreductase
MKYRQLGLSDLKVSTLGMGCIQFGDKADLGETERIVGRCLDLGINFFDTANVYSDGVGEEYLGRALGRRRQEIVLATKVGRVRMGPRRKLVRDSTADEIRAEIDASLKRLNTDYIDLYQIHWPDPDTPIEVSIGVMEELVKAGKVRHIGICNHAGDQVKRAHAACPGLATLQSPYNMFRRELEVETFPYCVHNGIGILPYWPLEQGVLAGRYTLGTLPADASPALRAQVAAVDELRPLAAQAGRPLAHLALAWLLARPGLGSVIPGASRLDQLEENCGVTDWALSPEDVQEIDHVLARAARPSR